MAILIGIEAIPVMVYCLMQAIFLAIFTTIEGIFLAIYVAIELFQLTVFAAIQARIFLSLKCHTNLALSNQFSRANIHPLKRSCELSFEIAFSPTLLA